MKTKRIAQLCCAALVAAGIGLNIQNALTDYGMNGDLLSLVATGGSNSNCSSPSSMTVTYIPPLASVVYQTVEYRNCGEKSGTWKYGYNLPVDFNAYTNSTNLWDPVNLYNSNLIVTGPSSEEKLSYYRWHESRELAGTITGPNGNTIEIYHRWATCMAHAGQSPSGCGYSGETLELGTY